MVKYFTTLNYIEENAIKQVEELREHEPIIDVAVFPDIHYCDEKGIPVGLAFTTRDVIYPLITGKDMGCGVAYLKIPNQYVLQRFDKNKHYRAFNKEHFTMTDEGLGGGNHFLSLEEDGTNLYIIVHTGTRNRGIYMYQKNMQLLADHGNEKFFTVDFLNKNYPEWFEEYNEVIEYGKTRRHQFLVETFEFLVRNKYVNANASSIYGDSVHNHIKKEGDLYVHRKGATELNDDTVVIPLSMTRGSLLVKKRPYTPDQGNLNSCSHGAGRKLSRTNTMKYWHSSLKEKERREYRMQFNELLDRNGEFPKGYIQEFDFAYKDSSTIVHDQSFLQPITYTKPICTVKFTEI